MKKLVFLFSCLILMFFSGFAQEVIENSKNPQNPKGGRIIDLLEIMRITDVDGEYYFKSPRELKHAADGSIFIRDWEQLLQFNENGNYIRNFIKFGEGPGETESFSFFQLMSEGILVKSFTPLKFLWFAYDGTLIKEDTRIEAASMDTFKLYCPERYYFLSTLPPLPSADETEVKVSHDLVSYADDFEKKKYHLSFETIRLIVREGSRRIALGISPDIVVPVSNRYLFISHTSEYLVKIFDAETNEVKTFRRPYRRIKSTKKDRNSGFEINGQPFYLPPQKYKNDIESLIPVDNGIWVVTSTVEKKGFLVDVFDFEGSFIDNFYLRFPEGSLVTSVDSIKIAVSSNYIFSIEQTEDGLFVIKKYKIVG